MENITFNVWENCFGTYEVNIDQTTRIAEDCTPSEAMDAMVRHLEYVAAFNEVGQVIAEITRDGQETENISQMVIDLYNEQH